MRARRPWRLKWTVLWSLWLARAVRQPTEPLRVSGGALRGSVAHDGSHRHYLGVPYATAGRHNRFQAPGPEPKWNGVFEAINENIRCTQRVGKSTTIGQENCLTLNVYTPLDASPNKPLPVMFFIHGGGFYDGSGSRFLYGPKYLVPKGVVLVTINYRLNIQGFICLGIKEAPGNAAMKDQVAALKWVKRNIRVFGGDPDNVTIFGESAGAAAVSYHIVSPMSKGLFHKAILQSGSSLAAWAYQFRPVFKASLLAKTMGLHTQDPHELYEYFMNKTDAELIVTRVPRKEGNIIISELLYVPCAEKVIDGEERFLTDLPYELLARGDYNKVPMIIGTNNEEGLLFAAMENDTMLAKITFEKSLPQNLHFSREAERNEIANKIKQIYMGDDEISRETILKLSRFHGELYFNYPSLAETELIAKSSNNPVYSYLLSYDGWKNLPKLSLGEPFMSTPGMTHADDLFYIFSHFMIRVPFIDMTMVHRITTMWTNLAKYGDPTPKVTELLPTKWLPVDVSSPQSLVIDEQFTMAPMWFTESLRYWHEVYTKYRRKL